MQRIEVENFGPIQKADIRFGDLTVLVGAQATGKSLFVQLFKALKDAGAIRADLNNYGFDWLHGTDLVQDYCSIYFGGGLGAIAARASVQRDGRPVLFKNIAKPAGRTTPEESTFLIPAQRVLVLQDGWPKPFMAYSEGDPYCLRRFSDTLRLLMEQGLGRGEAIFPQSRRLKVELKNLLNDAIYVGGTLRLDVGGTRKRIVLAPGLSGSALPYSAWSAGQREFTPLLLGLYWLMPAAKVSRRKGLDTVIIEEPEMGLHPQAIVGFGLLVLELLLRGYRVVLSTHSPVILDLVWALRELKNCAEQRALDALTDIFCLRRRSQQMNQVFQSALSKTYSTYFFQRSTSQKDTATEHTVVVRDISTLDPGDNDPNVAGWGGLTGFSGRIAQIVGEAVAPRLG